MKFSEKLTKLRKSNNLSQEALAEKLNMSRQAISKWESGNSYPDMSTMINICKVLNCTLEELLDDDAIGNNFVHNNKFNINKCIKELLDFITKSYNMFWSMRLKDKIKCIFELGLIISILIIISIIIGNILKMTIFQIFSFLPDNIYYYIFRLLKMIYSLFMISLGTIITIHLFKIRYLDYYITIEDNEVKDKTIEIEKNKDIKFKERKQEKIIIRDPSHTPYSFFKLIAKIIHIIIKIFIIFMIIPVIVSFIFLMFILTISLIWFKYGIIFIGIFIIATGLLLVNYDFIELMYKFIFNRTYNFKRIFILFISGLVLTGLGFGITFNQLTKYNIVNDTKYNNKVLTIDMNEDIVFDELNYNKVIIDNSIDNILVNVNYSYLSDITIKNDDNYYYIHLDYKDNELNIFKRFLNDVKNKEIKSYDNYYNINSITLSQKNYDKIKENNNNHMYCEYDCE